MLSLWTLSRLSCSVFALEFGYAAETAYVTPILFSLGLPVGGVALVWAMGPLVGVVLQPLLGSMSDRCTSRLGRRRPFIIGLSLFLISGLMLIPNAAALAEFALPAAWRDTATIALTILGVLLLDICSDGLQSPVRSYVIDVAPAEQQDRANSMLGLFGIGGCVGYVSGGTDWLRWLPFFGTQLRAVCVIAAAAFVLFMSLTVTSVAETPRSPSDDDGD